MELLQKLRNEVDNASIGWVEDDWGEGYNAGIEAVLYIIDRYIKEALAHNPTPGR